MNAKKAVTLILCVALVACPKSGYLQIVRIKDLTPMVAPDPATGEFLINAAVKNLSSAPTPTRYFIVETSFSDAPSCPSGGTSFAQAVFEVPPLQPNEGWSLGQAKRLMEVGTFSACSCQKGSCGGKTVFTLSSGPGLAQGGPIIPVGKPSVLELDWSSGEPSQYTLVDKSLTQ